MRWLIGVLCIGFGFGVGTGVTAENQAGGAASGWAGLGLRRTDKFRFYPMDGNGNNQRRAEAVEEPGYSVVEEFPHGVEIRKYSAPQLTLLTAGHGPDVRESDKNSFKGLFMKNFRYIQGENVAQEKYAMTAPVLSWKDSTHGYKPHMAFIMLTATQGMSQMPAPSDELKNDGVQFYELDTSYKVASIKFSGWATDRQGQLKEGSKKYLQVLKNFIRRTPRLHPKPGVDVVLAQYDAPWTIFGRRNEFWIILEDTSEYNRGDTVTDDTTYIVSQEPWPATGTNPNAAEADARAIEDDHEKLDEDSDDEVEKETNDSEGGRGGDVPAEVAPYDIQFQ